DYHNAERGQNIRFELASWRGLHSSEWPVGVYRKAHYHGPGAILVCLKSVGYVLLWDKKYGIHPYQDGHGDKVVKVNWKAGSIYSPQNGWFHQHFNTGKEPARHLALRLASKSEEEIAGDADITRLQDGGRLIGYEDEDPEIRRMFRQELRKNGVKFTMKPVVYRTGPLPQLP
ncbi:MAG: hypothetical protein Q8P59_04105, partial [Dehalococcoidia bacterium]|nr:hypothetical protein [Dehalococcoidia bacterium]